MILPDQMPPCVSPKKVIKNAENATPTSSQMQPTIYLSGYPKKKTVETHSGSDQLLSDRHLRRDEKIIRVCSRYMHEQAGVHR